MMIGTLLEDRSEIEQLRDDYAGALVAPLDGMWEKAVIAQATFWRLRDQGQPVGYFCLDAENTLLRFYLAEPYRARAQEHFLWVISTHQIQRAIASTLEPLYFSLCLGVQRSVTLHSYLFRDSRAVIAAPNFGQGVFRQADSSELYQLMDFYQANTEGPGTWIEGFLRARLQREELFVLEDGQTLLATGECIPSLKQPPYADLGMVVAQSCRGKGLGSSMLMRLKQHCADVGLKPICSCEASNYASKKAIEKAGFISEHRMVTMQF
jgi:GNAT superfamily N-acetyltransferase